MTYPMYLLADGKHTPSSTLSTFLSFTFQSSLFPLPLSGSQSIVDDSQKSLDAYPLIIFSPFTLQSTSSLRRN